MDGETSVILSVNVVSAIGVLVLGPLPFLIYINGLYLESMQLSDGTFIARKTAVQEFHVLSTRGLQAVSKFGKINELSVQANLSSFPEFENYL